MVKEPKNTLDQALRNLGRLGDCSPSPSTHAIYCRNGKKSFQRKHFFWLDCLEIVFPKLPFFKYSSWIYAACAYKNNIVTWNNKSGGKCERFPEEYPKCERFYKKIQVQSLFHKCRKLQAITRELECMAWDVLQKVFYIDLSYCKERQSLVIPFTVDIRNWLYIAKSIYI